MNAVVVNDYCSDLSVQKISAPVISNPNDIIVNVKAAAVNPGDVLLQRGIIKVVMPLKFPAVLGHDFAGIVHSVGSNVKNFKEGDRVMGTLIGARFGTYAEYAKVICGKDAIELLPDGLSWEEGAALGTAALVAYIGLVEKGKLNDKSNVLVIGASGGIGSYAVKIAKALCCNLVTGICSTKNVEFVKSMGADNVIDYCTGSIPQAFESLGIKYHLVIDTVGGMQYYTQVQPHLEKNAFFVSATGPESVDPLSSKPFTIPKILGFAGGMLVRAITKPRYLQIATLNISLFHNVADLAGKGKLRGGITTFPMSNANEAHKISASKRAVGKLVINEIK